VKEIEMSSTIKNELNQSYVWENVAAGSEDQKFGIRFRKSTPARAGHAIDREQRIPALRCELRTLARIWSELIARP
jgi:hypothetical protein